MRRKFGIVTAMVLVFPFLVGGLSHSATGKSLRLSNRFGPTGTYSVDPLGRPGILKGLQGPRVPVPNPTGSGGCPDASAHNVRANQECTNQSAAGLLGRGESQNETSVAVNPLDPKNVLVSQNDYRQGDASCGVDWSLDGGKHFGSQTLPTRFTAPGFVATRHYWDASGDTSVAFDSSGEAYLLCQVFDRDGTDDTSDDASGVLLFRSANGGASWSFDGSVVAADDGTQVGLHDKPYMLIDNNPDSPFVDRIYVAWVKFSLDFTTANLVFEYSTDHGNSWSAEQDIGGFDTDLCPINFDGSPPGTCNAFQFPAPFVDSNGDVYVVAQNFNNCAGALREFGYDCPGPAGDNHNQMLIVKSTNGGDTWTSPVKVADYNELPDCVTYTGYDFGRECIPTAPLSGTSIFRAVDYPSGVALSDSHILVTFGSYINRDSNAKQGNCTPAGLSVDTFLNLYDGVGTVDGCNNDILVSESTDGGASFTGTSIGPARLPAVSKELGVHAADQWWQWTAKTASGDAVTNYYDRSYGSDMATGFMDLTLAHGSSFTRVTDQSLPPSNEFPDVNGYSVFMGDYTGLAVGSDGVAHPAWADTRNPIYTYDDTPGSDPRTLVFAGYGADIYTTRLSVG